MATLKGGSRKERPVKCGRMPGLTPSPNVWQGQGKDNALKENKIMSQDGQAGLDSTRGRGSSCCNAVGRRPDGARGE